MRKEWEVLLADHDQQRVQTELADHARQLEAQSEQAKDEQKAQTKRLAQMMAGKMDTDDAVVARFKTRITELSARLLREKKDPNKGVAAKTRMINGGNIYAIQNETQFAVEVGIAAKEVQIYVSAEKGSSSSSSAKSESDSKTSGLKIGGGGKMATTGDTTKSDSDQHSISQSASDSKASQDSSYKQQDAQSAGGKVDFNPLSGAFGVSAQGKQSSASEGADQSSSEGHKQDYAKSDGTTHDYKKEGDASGGGKLNIGYNKDKKHASSSQDAHASAFDKTYELRTEDCSQLMTLPPSLGVKEDIMVELGFNDIDFISLLLKLPNGNKIPIVRNRKVPKDAKMFRLKVDQEHLRQGYLTGSLTECKKAYPFQLAEQLQKLDEDIEMAKLEQGETSYVKPKEIQDLYTTFNQVLGMCGTTSGPPQGFENRWDGGDLGGMARQMLPAIAEQVDPSTSAIEAKPANPSRQWTDCEWMFGDAGNGDWGFKELAHLNPFRWSGGLSISHAIADLEEVLQNGSRPIVVRIPANTGERTEFKTTQEAIDFLKNAKSRV